MVSKKTLFLALACVLLAAIPSAFGEGYPSRPITIVVPFSAGGPTDTLARILAQRMTVSLGQNVIIENVTGAAGSIAVGRVVSAQEFTSPAARGSTAIPFGALRPLWGKPF
jgi:tripartite-type tricarboxylate transporter receptor subunit TctC